MTFIVYVNNGFRYEFETTIEAGSVKEARQIWKRRGDWKSKDFRVSRSK